MLSIGTQLRVAVDAASSWLAWRNEARPVSIDVNQNPPVIQLEPGQFLSYAIPRSSGASKPTFWANSKEDSGHCKMVFIDTFTYGERQRVVKLVALLKNGAAIEAA